MRQEILERLAALTPEERKERSSADPEGRALYTRSGRFLIERRRMSALSSGEATSPISLRPHPRFRSFPLHFHDYIEMMYVCSGTVTHRIGDEVVTLHADDLILLGRDTRHSIEAAGEEDIGINLIVSTDLFESLFQSMRRTSRTSGNALGGLLARNGTPYLVFCGRDSLGVRNLMESMIDATICRGEDNSYLMQQSLALLLGYLAAMSEEGEAETRADGESMKRRILDYIRTSYSTATLTEAAQMLGLSPPYLSRVCRQRFGESFRALLMRERFTAACGLLTSTDMPIGDIIWRVGYENSSYFHKEFKRRFGVTPKEYRRSGGESLEQASVL